MIDYLNITRKVIACSLCGAMLFVSANGLICQNMNCPDYLLEKHEHTPEQKIGPDSPVIQQTTTSGTALSGATGAYGPINFTKLDKEGGES